MPKNETRQGRPVKADAAPARPRAAVAERRIRPPAESADAPIRPTRAAALRLAAEVERLELELAAARSEIVALAAHVDTDPLTGVLNRRGFERELKRALAYLKRYDTSAALLFVDLDRFKAINDSHGHAAGDAVLRAVAMVIARQVRASDLVARLGGDEFVVLLWNLTRGERTGQGGGASKPPSPAPRQLMRAHGYRSAHRSVPRLCYLSIRPLPCLNAPTPPCMPAKRRAAASAPRADPSQRRLGRRGGRRSRCASAMCHIRAGRWID